jgi:protein gp37
MSDLFHEKVPDEFIAAVWVRMLWTSPEAAIRTYRSATAPCHTYQVLTKRPGRMRSWVRRWADPQQRRAWMRAAVDHGWCHPRDISEAGNWPAVLPNVWLGVSVENQRWADVRIPLLMETPAAVRWLSCEPLLGPVDIHIATTPFDPPIDWIVVGGESGYGARPMHPDWARLIRNYCIWKNVPFLLKQWGEWTPAGLGIGIFRSPELLIGEPVDEMGHRQIMRRVGKGRAGRELDGVVWDQYPERAA